MTILIASLASTVLRADEPRPAGHRQGAIEQPVVAFRSEDELQGKAGAPSGDISIPQAKASLAGFEAFVDDVIKKWEVPGLALVIVKDGEIVLERGFGYRDLKNKLPVTPQTLFAIGSCTKAFTTFVMGTLVDEGKMDWDTPLRTYIPELRMYDRTTTELITPRDLVTHRTGLPRHDAVWGNPALSRKQIVERLQYFEPSEPFRSKYQYNKMMYMTAGYLVERLTGKPWEDAVRARVFEPLGMTSSNVSVKELQRSADHALPYEDRNDKIVETPFGDVSILGPAGSINSSAVDMARCVSVHTHKGIHAGRQIISPAVLTDMHTPHMIINAPQERKEIAPMGYGLGWFVDDYRGHRRVWHAGEVRGFSARTAFFPQDGLEIVALTNLQSTQLPEIITRYAADRILGLSPIDWSGEELTMKAQTKAAAKEARGKQNSVRKLGTSPAHKLEEYAGEYEHPRLWSAPRRASGREALVTLWRHRGPPGTLALRGVQRPQVWRGIGLREREASVLDQPQG